MVRAHALSAQHGIARGFAMLVLVLVLVLVLTLPAAESSEPFRFEPPAPLAAAGVQRALIGNTHTYLSGAASALPRMTITTMQAGEIDQRFGALTGRRCIDLFLGELARAHTGFFVADQAEPLKVADEALTQFRWSGERNGRALTGVLGCGRVGRYYLVVDFVDDLRAATVSFPRIRASLRALALGTLADHTP